MTYLSDKMLHTSYLLKVSHTFSVLHNVAHISFEGESHSLSYIMLHTFDVIVICVGQNVVQLELLGQDELNFV